MTQRVAAFITSHGYGHAAVVTAVLSTFARRRPDVALTLVTRVPEAVLRGRLTAPFTYLPHVGESDFGMRMDSSTRVRVADSLDGYRRAHDRWDAVVAAEAEVLRAVRPDVVISCAGYACLEAARRLGLPGLGLGPFTWTSILEAYDGAAAGANVLAEMTAAYAGAEAFLETAPAVPSGLPNAVTVGPVGGPAQVDAAAVRARLGVGRGEILALLSMGGIPERLNTRHWPTRGVRWLTSGDTDESLTPVAAAGLTVSEAVAAADVVVTKPGYGIFVEAACAGTGILYLDRPDWPETEGLRAWAARHVPISRIDTDTMDRGAFAEQLHIMVQSPRDPLPHPSGNEHVSDFIEKFL